MNKIRHLHEINSNKNPQLLMGAHMSIAGGLAYALSRGADIGCTAIQIFLHNNRQWPRAQSVKQEMIENYLATLKISPISIVVAHANYLINVASTRKDVIEKSIQTLILELELCHLLKMPYLIVHIASLESHQELRPIAEKITEVLTHVRNNSVMLLIETMAGQGNNTCYRFEQIARIHNDIAPHLQSRVGVCFDTCHVFAAGYDMRSEKQYEQVMHEFTDTIGLEKLRVIHLNDSQKECGSRIDRHADIGKGKLGLPPFALLLNDSRLLSVPKILETPKQSPQDDLRNLQTVLSLLKPHTRKLYGLTS